LHLLCVNKYKEASKKECLKHRHYFEGFADHGYPLSKDVINLETAIA
jgi:hypothetical protein